ncbi:hypothetical protein MKEN_01188500 [Mycena kentingensis (nom. inval.)]|nr:hypothetical protein MKEN_01188500 [Mycena kentingensis (nom. inval.)]
MLHTALSTHSPSEPFRIYVQPPLEDNEDQYIVFDERLPDPELPPTPSIDQALCRIAQGEPAPPFDRAALEGVVLPRRSPEAQASDETVNDDSIVEIVKVRRSSYQDQDQEPAAKTKSLKPKSLRARAGSAFRSIKNLARPNRSSSVSSNRPYAQEVYASSQSTQATFATVDSPPLSRRGSILLTDLFRTPSRASSPYITVPVATTTPYSEDADDTDEDDYDRQSMASRVPSPSPSGGSFTTTMRRRLSILSFSRKTRTSDPAPPASPPALSRDSTVPSTFSSSAPTTPTDEIYPQPPPSAKDNTDDPDRTVTGEMVLDSFHFEALSFDADRF